ncbi:complement resistance protein TraT [Serratia ureilytica]|uniref:complement resistance protein TraT n=1 Tax=Serratia ureilytica TaxID=300181 RepID=UPI0034C6C851
MQKLKKILLALSISVIASALTGCGTLATAVKKRHLEVKTEMSETIWLAPSSKKTVYIQVKNTSNKEMAGLQTKIAKHIQDRGHIVTKSSEDAHYWIQLNVLKIDKMDILTSQRFLTQGYEGAALGTALGVGVTAYNSDSAGAILGVGIAAGLVGMVVDTIVEDINYSMVTDIQITERMVIHEQTTQPKLTAGYKHMNTETISSPKKHHTRVVSSANKINLNYEDARPVLEDQLALSVANIL